MGLDMKTKKKLTEETAKRYCRAGKNKNYALQQRREKVRAGS